MLKMLKLHPLKSNFVFFILAQNKIRYNIKNTLLLRLLFYSDRVLSVIFLRK